MSPDYMAYRGDGQGKHLINWSLNKREEHLWKLLVHKMLND
ncbi:hypothetical protein HMPREF0766_12204 [Sphingobacterium spiritivorum ATCC 33861]|uniref:Uncharacterized protein n=1 Tax=Sphingobacterium spiritivorum ATCC 33861 TaxID=525373 RepID=D7VLV0_SPHSI|nr:hypothetical protein HMPREF0766_12204 [Sphingobacterium spiritivorum ATCC 33861]